MLRLPAQTPGPPPRPSSPPASKEPRHVECRRRVACGRSRVQCVPRRAARTARSRADRRPRKVRRARRRMRQRCLRAQKYLVLPDEDGAEFTDLEAALVAELAPVGALQTVLARRVAIAAWRLARAAELFEERRSLGGGLGSPSSGTETARACSRRCCAIAARRWPSSGAPCAPSRRAPGRRGGAGRAGGRVRSDPGEAAGAAGGIAATQHAEPNEPESRHGVFI